MKTSTSTALVPVAPAQAADTMQGCGRTGGAMSRRSKWLIFAAAALAIAGLVTGSVLFGFAAVLPLLYTLPCAIMVAMCMFGMNRGDGARN